MIVEYGPNEGYEDLSTSIEESRVYESVAEWFNATYALPQDLWLGSATCGTENAFYIPEASGIIMCYEMVELIAQTFFQAQSDGTIAWTDEQLESGFASTWFFILFHELGHALVDLYDLPVTGREEDAVDGFSSVLLIENGSSDAVFYAALFWQLLDDGDVSSVDLADEHGLNMQRFYNMLCLLYGSDPTTWSQLEAWPELEGRLPRCENEYAQARDSWQALLQPWVL